MFAKNQPGATLETEMVDLFLIYTGRALVLLAVSQDRDASVSTIASKAGLTSRSVQRILAQLLEEGTISREWQGHHMKTMIIDPDLPPPIVIPLSGEEAIEPVRRLLANHVDEDGD